MSEQGAVSLHSASSLDNSESSTSFQSVIEEFPAQKSLLRVGKESASVNRKENMD
jgi:hypothetical protein